MKHSNTLFRLSALGLIFLAAPAAAYDSNAATCGAFPYSEPSGFAQNGPLDNGPNPYQPSEYIKSDDQLTSSSGVELRLLRPASDPLLTKKATVIFVHGGNGENNFDRLVYDTYLSRIYTRGIQVLYVQHQGDYTQIQNALNEILNTNDHILWKNGIDQSRLMFAGHSYGGSAILSLASWAASQGFGSNVLAIHSSAPYLPLPRNTETAATMRPKLSALPAHTQSIFQIYKADENNDHNLAQFYYNNITGSKYWYTVNNSLKFEGDIVCRYWADHYLAGTVNPVNFNYGAVTYAKLGAALAAWLFGVDSNGQSVVTNGRDTGSVTQNGVNALFVDMDMTVPQCDDFNHDIDLIDFNRWWQCS